MPRGSKVPAGPSFTGNREHPGLERSGGSLGEFGRYWGDLGGALGGPGAVLGEFGSPEWSWGDLGRSWGILGDFGGWGVVWRFQRDFGGSPGDHIEVWEGSFRSEGNLGGGVD